jgi:uncharacterized DUF497 family protein
MNYNVTDLRWDSFKNERLKRERGVSFEEIILARFLAVIEHPSRANQKIILFEREEYVWVVPYVKREKETFLKTMFPSRKYTRMWKRGELP